MIFQRFQRAIGLAAIAWLASGVQAVAQELPADIDASSGARLPYLTRQDLGEEGLRLADIFARNGEPTDPVSGPLAFAAYNVSVANALLDLHDGAVGQGSLDADIRELAIAVDEHPPGAEILEPLSR